MEAGRLLGCNEKVFPWGVSVRVQMSITYCEIIQSDMKHKLHIIETFWYLVSTGGGAMKRRYHLTIKWDVIKASLKKGHNCISLI